MSNKILDNLIHEDANTLFKAYSRAYNQAKLPKHINNLLVLMAFISPVLIHFAVKEDIKLYTTLFGVFWLAFSLFFENSYKNKHKRAVIIHQEFDYFVFGWKWNNNTNDSKIPSTEIQKLSMKHKKDLEPNWYSQKIDKNLHSTLAILFAFMHTLFQETQQRKVYINILYLLLLIYYISLITIGIITDIGTSDFFLTYIFPTLAFAKFTVSGIMEHKQLLTKQEDELSKISDFIENYRITNQLPDEQILYRMQHFITDYRKKAIAVPSWLYKLLEKKVTKVVDAAIMREKKLTFPEQYKKPDA